MDIILEEEMVDDLFTRIITFLVVRPPPRYPLRLTASFSFSLFFLSFSYTLFLSFSLSLCNFAKRLGHSPGN